MKQKNIAISDTQSKNIAMRLKELRENAKISHEKLAKATGISKDTLIKYEKSDEFNTSFGTNKGMCIEFAVSLAKFYDTSTDYILCNTDIKSPDVSISDICNKTGLSETAVNQLFKLNKANLTTGGNSIYFRCINLINVLLEKSNGIEILGSIADYLYNIHTDGYEEYSDGSKRLLKAEDLNDTDLYLNIMPQLKEFQRELSRSDTDGTK